MSGEERRGGMRAPEVEMAEEINSCRACDWFWRQPPYGPYPAYDFQEAFPPEVAVETAPQKGQRSFAGVSAGQQPVAPAMLSGCRKAPIMTVGINPNMASFWPGKNGAAWCYPLFEDPARRAYYYRYHSLFQESLPLRFVEEHLLDQGRLIARQKGHIEAMIRDPVERTLAINIRYAGSIEPELVKCSWNEGENFVVLFDRSVDGRPQFEKGQVIGGFTDIPLSMPVDIRRNLVGYYQRFVPVLDNLSAYLRSQGMEPGLKVAEDVSQLDMVACASPGWVDKYDIDKTEVVENCVRQKGWAARQLLQARPAVMVFSGRSAFEMFAGEYSQSIRPELDSKAEVFGLLEETVKVPRYLTLGQGERAMRTRVLVAPHFSYADNFIPQARFSERAWQAFCAAHPGTAEGLEARGLVGKMNRDGYLGVRLGMPADLPAGDEAARLALLRRICDPTEMLAQALKQEMLLGNLTFDRSRRNLGRALGDCRFCVNDSWRFPRGCPYR